MKRIDRKDVDAMIDESKEPDAAAPAESALPPPARNSFGDGEEALQAEPLAPTCTIDEFAKVDLRVARVLAAAEVPGADKLLQLTVNLGGNATRTVFAGIKQAYRPDQLVGRLVVVVANLVPRKMKFGVSEGMVVASGPGGSDVFLLGVDSGAKPGQRVH
jgi:methionyl-tRNA synthetase